MFFIGYFGIGFLLLMLMWRERMDLPASAPFYLFFLWPCVVALVIRREIREWRIRRRFERDRRAMLNNEALLRELLKRNAYAKHIDG